MSKSYTGKLDVQCVGLTRLRATLISLGVTLAALAASSLTSGNRFQASALAAGALGALVWFVLRKRYARLDCRLTKEVGKWLTLGESCLAVTSPRGEERKLESLLRDLSPSRVFAVELSPHGEDPPTPQGSRRPSHLWNELASGAAELAAGHRLHTVDTRGQRLRVRLGLAAKRHERACAMLAAAVRRSAAESDAVDWLLDNAHVVRAHAADIRRNLPHAYYRFLPTVAEGGEPILRVYALARQLVASTDARVTIESITRCLDAYQERTPLLIAELWVFPLMVRMVLVETIAALAEQVVRTQRLLEDADFLADRHLAAARTDGVGSSRVLELIVQRHGGLEPCLIARLGEYFSDDAASTNLLETWLEERFQTTFPLVVNQYHAAEGAVRISVSNAVGSFRVLSEVDFSDIFERVSKVEAVLRQDPAGMYTRSDFATRDRCRRVVEVTARHSTHSENEIAGIVLEMARAGQPSVHDRKRHVGYYLLDEGITKVEARVRCRPPWGKRLSRWVLRHATAAYLTSICGLTGLLLALCVGAANAAGWASPWLLAAISVLAAFPASELAIHVVHSLVIVLLKPLRLPQMDYGHGIPEDCRTLVVIPMMLGSADAIERLAAQLEVHFLSTRDANVSFALLSDYHDSVTESTEEDKSLLTVAKQAIESLNERYSTTSFVLFHRRRQWSASEQSWIGWERKRGKLEELNRFLVGSVDAPGLDFVAAGRAPEAIRYVITLDSDTQLPTGSARSLVETISHPLNRVELASDGRSRLRGYTLIQPRVNVTLPGATATRFTRLFTDTAGADPYCQAVSDVYQDLFHEANYHGKAIYEVSAFHAILNGRFPDQTLLSHDLIEGAHVGVGLASHIELFEKFPETYESYLKREHRWTRGDWQISDWATPRIPVRGDRITRNPLSGINRWKILDNLRRSLTPLGSTALLLVCWLTPIAPSIYGLLVILAMLIPTLSNVAQRIGAMENVRPDFSRLFRKDFARAFADIALLPHRAYVLSDAVVRVWFRRLISHRDLLEWQPADTVRQQRIGIFGGTYLQTFLVSVCSTGLMAYLLMTAQSQIASPFLALWMASPLIVKWLDGEEQDTDGGALSDADRLELRKMARRTWRYFDDLVSPEGNWLPPDNVQEDPRYEVAMRTSPTNIGLWLMAALTARDFGYLALDELLERTQSTYAALGKLERYEGHFLNWYHIDSLTPIEPRYVSSVDSGNFVAACWLFAEGLRGLARSPLVEPNSLHGLNDTLRIVREEIAHLGTGSKEIRTLAGVLDPASDRAHDVVESLRQAKAPIARLAALLQWSHPDEVSKEAVYWISRLQGQITEHVRSTDQYLDWMTILEAPPDSFLLPLGGDAPRLRESALAKAPSLEALARGRVFGLNELLVGRNRRGEIPDALAEWLNRVQREVDEAARKAAQALEHIQELAAGFTRFGDETNFRFLYDNKRNLFAIGYRPGESQDFGSHYDLLASEARLMSYVAIAKGDAPVEHWWHLGRQYGRSGDVLLSWNGSLFEYLMPPLFNVSYQSSLLDNACRSAIRAQIEHGAGSNVPWGVSESAHSGLDANHIYQYRAFGTPALGMKRGLGEDLVVAPYATMMALQFAPDMALRNLRALKGQELYGRMGFYEAIDYSRPAKRGGTAGVKIRAYMAHHQGMSLMGLNNALHDGALQRRFHSDPRVRAIESLLFERIPASPPRILNPTAAAEARGVSPPKAPVGQSPEVQAPPAAPFRTHMLGHDGFSVVLNGAGGGYARWREFDVTRWRLDTASDDWGQFLYLRDTASGAVWLPARTDSGRSTQSRPAVNFHPDRAEIRSANAGIETLIDVMVAPEDDVQIHRITLTNQTLRTRRLEVTSYCELALAAHNADRAHPAFSKLFVQTETIAERKTLLAWRRLRSPDEAPVWCAQTLVGPRLHRFESDTDRARFLGRQGNVLHPALLGERLSGTDGSVLDPAFAMRGSLRLGPRRRERLVLVTAVAESREAALLLIAKYQDVEYCDSAFELAWTRAQLELRYLRLTTAQAALYQELAGLIVYPSARFRASPERLARNKLAQSRLWAYGLSGDLPIFAVMIGNRGQLELIRELLQAHTYLRLQGFRCDFLILNQEPEAYDQPLGHSLLSLIQGHTLHTGVDRPGGVFLRSVRHIPAEDLDLLLAVSRVVLSSSRGSLLQQLRRPASAVLLPDYAVAGSQDEEPSAPLPFLDLAYFNGLGGFTADGREYVIYLSPGAITPLPWINVMANPSFGAVVSESGSGFVWAGNSQSNRLTPWHNDPVTDPCSDVIYIRDDETGAIWTPTPRPIREDDAYRARHGQGYSSFEHNSHSIEQWLDVFVPADADGGAPLKIQRLRLRNASSQRRRLTVTSYSEIVMGTDREETQMHVRSEWDSELEALLFRNPYNSHFDKRVVFAAANPNPVGYTADRTIFLGPGGSVGRPAALRRQALAGRVGPGLDPCAALQVHVELDPGEERSIVFLLGQAANVEEAHNLVHSYSGLDDVTKALDSTRAYWDHVLGAIEVETPVLSVNLLLNRWLVYQTLSCRIWARSALYQSGGAYGFRDQLQDVMALLYTSPETVREQLLRAAARQFIEGDVQHWWHPQTGLGARTRCSDDLLWLPYVVAQYIRVSGDHAVLDELVPFLVGPLLEGDEQEKISTPEPTAERATLFEHCRRAIAKASAAGVHGLPLIGSGDWNDGMNRIGPAGRGESVWLAWFLIDVLRSFAELCSERGEESAAGQYRAQAENWRATAEKSGWDGAWYRRGYFDDGTPVGTQLAAEAQIDSLPQSWAAISGAGDPERRRQAMDSVERRLVDHEHRTVLLFTPPFDRQEPHPGYIMGYPPGVRENGGQYTHAAIWVALAYARLGDGGMATNILELLSPVEHARSAEEVERYKGEPYVIAADVYSLLGREGRCGWTWYTGSAGWLYRTWIEEVLGLQLRGGHLYVRPVVSDAWDGFRFRYRRGAAVYHVQVVRGAMDGQVELDGVRLAGSCIPVVDDGQQHHATVWFTAMARGPDARA